MVIFFILIHSHAHNLISYSFWKEFFFFIKNIYLNLIEIFPNPKHQAHLVKDNFDTKNQNLKKKKMDFYHK